MGEYDEENGRHIKDPYGFIYIITNLVNGKRYIGQKKFDIGGRWKKYMGGGKLLAIAQGKYGIENFKRDIIYISYSIEESNRVEYEMIEYFNAVRSLDYYNMIDGGDVSPHIFVKKVRYIHIKTLELFHNQTELNKYKDLNRFLEKPERNSNNNKVKLKNKYYMKYDDYLSYDNICRHCYISYKTTTNEIGLCSSCNDLYLKDSLVCQELSLIYARIENRVRLCESCGKEHILKRGQRVKRMCDDCNAKSKIKKCIVCDTVIEKNSNSQKYCKACSKISYKQSNKMRQRRFRKQEEIDGT